MSQTSCYIHPENSANTTCERCERPICAQDHRRVTTTSSTGALITRDKKLVCPECKDIVKAKQKKRERRMYMIMGFVTVASIAVFVWLFNDIGII